MKEKIQEALLGLTNGQREALTIAVFGKADMTEEGWAAAGAALDLVVAQWSKKEMGETNMFVILVKSADSEDEVLLPQEDEYPGSSPWFLSADDAKEVAVQVIGLGLSDKLDENKIVSSRVMQLVEVKEN